MLHAQISDSSIARSRHSSRRRSCNSRANSRSWRFSSAARRSLPSRSCGRRPSRRSDRRSGSRSPSARRYDIGEPGRRVFSRNTVKGLPNRMFLRLKTGSAALAIRSTVPAPTPYRARIWPAVSSFPDNALLDVEPSLVDAEQQLDRFFLGRLFGRQSVPFVPAAQADDQNDGDDRDRLSQPL